MNFDMVYIILLLLLKVKLKAKYQYLSPGTSIITFILNKVNKLQPLSTIG